MDLSRFVLLSSDDERAAKFKGHGIEMTLGGVVLHASRWTSDDRWLVQGTIPLASRPYVVNEVVDLVGVAELDELDGALHTFVAMLAATTEVLFRPSAVTPMIGLLGDVSDLQELAGRQTNLPISRVTARVRDSADISASAFHALADRPEGAALLAEAISHKNALGRYSQLLRLMERAFGRGVGKFNGELQEFLRAPATRHLFTSREIQHWIDGRPRVLHADRPNHPIWFERDVALVVNRLHEAAVDLLFNKANWNSSEVERRNVRVPRRGTLDSEAGIFITRGMDVSAEMQVFDSRGSFPLAMNGGLSLGQVPFGLWTLPNGRSLDLMPLGADSLRDDSLQAEATQLEPGTFAGGPMLVYDEHDDTVRYPDDDDALT